MKLRIMIFIILGMVIFPSCYTTANIRRIETKMSHNKSIVYSYQIGGLQQMFVFIDPGRGIIYDKYDRFTQEQLSNIRVKIKSLSGQIRVRGKTIHKGETREVNLREGIIGRYGSDKPDIGDIGKYVPTIRVVSVDGSIPPEKLNFILFVEDLTGFTHVKGIRLSGGFQDSL